jgi:CheY-like chemotaxis protein
MISQPAILYVEDEKSDVLLLRAAFTRASLTNPVHVVVDGAEAIDYLAGNGPFADRSQHPLPVLVLLDLNLPKKSGFDVFRWIRQQPQFSSLPVVIYTSSVGLIDKDTARQFGATDYFVKRSGVNNIAELARSLAERWLTPAVLA